MSINSGVRFDKIISKPLSFVLNALRIFRLLTVAPKKPAFMVSLSLWLMVSVPGSANVTSAAERHQRKLNGIDIWQRQNFVPAEKRVRLIISSDAANEADDQAAIAYALLSPKFAVKGIVAAHFKPHRGSRTRSESESTEASYKEIQLLLKIMSLDHCVPVFQGSKGRFAKANETLNSEGVDFIIREALSDDPRPLVVLVLGPLTDLAAAQMKEERIAQRLTSVWIGGGSYPKGGPEYNQDSDRIAADLVMKSRIPLWQIPLDLYLLPRFGLIEAKEKIGQQGELGNFLFNRLDDFRTSYQIDNELLLYADLPAVGVLLFPLSSGPASLGSFRSELRKAPSISESGYYVVAEGARQIRVFQSIDQRAILEDFFAKLAAFNGNRLSPNCDSPGEKKVK